MAVFELLQVKSDDNCHVALQSLSGKRHVLSLSPWFFILSCCLGQSPASLFLWQHGKYFVDVMSLNLLGKEAD